MGKYSSIDKSIYSVFSTPAWLAESIKTVPANYNGTGLGNEYLRVSIVPGSSFAYANMPKSSAGQLIIDIFAPFGEGSARISTIADLLDTYLVSKSFAVTNGKTQFSASSLAHLGKDSANPSLYRSSYSISFNYFEK